MDFFFVNMNKVAMNILIHVFGRHAHSIPLSTIQETELSGHRIAVSLALVNFVSFLKQLCIVRLLPAMVKVPISPHSWYYQNFSL